MSLQTGGVAVGAISTRSTSRSSAIRSASRTGTIPSCSPFSPTRRTSGAVISPFSRCALASCAMWYLLACVEKLGRASRGRLLPEAFDEDRQIHLPEILTAAGAHGHLACGPLLVADDQLIGELLQAMFPDFIGNFFVPQVRFDAEAGCLERVGDLGGVVGLVLGDVEDDHLDRRQPERHRTGIVLEQDPDEPLHRPDDRPVEQSRALP